MESDLIPVLLIVMWDQLLNQAEILLVMLQMDGLDLVEMIQLQILVLRYVEMERKLSLKDEMMITLIAMMVEVHYECKKQDGHELEGTQVQLILELKIEEMVSDLILTLLIVMLGQLLAQAETHLVM